ncbi:fucolectin-1-like [Mytilus californianus]|uniref:fucolectin-1-like n=1 Tax=Mytilus californianus TaxID=6549 RepID=UPI0022469518|nr:fucolectin-1-like [Mytilus californianus]
MFLVFFSHFSIGLVTHEKLSTQINTNTAILRQILAKLNRDNPDVENLQEVAEGKTSTQSSQHTIYKPGNANDGILNTFSHTTGEQSPYWEVDLGRVYKIKQIEIFVRRYCCGDLIRQLDITAGPSHNLMTRCAFYPGPAKTGYHLAFECSPIIFGRYVKIQKNGTSNLALAEVKVMAIVDRTVG